MLDPSKEILVFAVDFCTRKDGQWSLRGVENDQTRRGGSKTRFWKTCDFVRFPPPEPTIFPAPQNSQGASTTTTIIFHKVFIRLPQSNSTTDQAHQMKNHYCFLLCSSSKNGHLILAPRAHQSIEKWGLGDELTGCGACSCRPSNFVLNYLGLSVNSPTNDCRNRRPLLIFMELL